MSIYSGFATRQQQQTYDHCTNSLLYILQKRILKFYTNEKTDEFKFTSLVQKMYLQMRHMEKSKYLQPKCSYALRQLFDYLVNSNDTQRNAKLQETSKVDDSLKHQVSNKQGYQQNGLQQSYINQPHRKQKVYQIPIRTDKNSLNKNQRANNSSLNSIGRKVGKIVSSKSRQKQQLSTIQQGKNVIRQKKPWTSHGSHLVRNKVIFNKHHKQQAVNRQQNMQSKQNQIARQRKTSSKNSPRHQIQNQNNVTKEENQINKIIEDYILKKKRIHSSNQNRSRNRLNESLSSDKMYLNNNK